ncbi:MAG: hypothetical protein EB084_02300 [Proteobacteria bacterium]|nr:hypothetical protein [Pseudomonadota bacterium]
MARVSDSVEIALSHAAVIALSNPAGEVMLGRTTGAPRARVERTASAPTEAQARALLEAIRVHSDIDGVDVVGVDGRQTQASLGAWIGDVDAVTVSGRRVEVRDLGCDVICTVGEALDVRACGGFVQARVTSGGVDVRDVCGRLQLTLDHGTIRVSDSSGHLDAHCLDGDVCVEGFAGDIVARAPRGEVRVSNVESPSMKGRKDLL